MHGFIYGLFSFPFLLPLPVLGAISGRADDLSFMTRTRTQAGFWFENAVI